MALETETIAGVPILRVGDGFHGVNCPPDGCRFTEAYLDELVDTYWTSKTAIEPPVKLGHDENQAILQEDGFPAAGLVANLRRLGDRLVADLVDVPKQVAELIRAGAYRTVSVELMQDTEIGGTTYAKILTGLALLGADLPAITSLGGITALYQKLQLKADGATIILNEIDNQPSNTPPSPAVQDGQGGNEMAELGEIRRALGIDEDSGDVLAAITGLNVQIATLTQTIQADAPDKGEVVQLRAELSEANQRVISLDNEKNSELLTLREKVHNMEAAHRVDQAISAGRITPANRAIALKVALGQSEEDFNRFVAALPRIDLSERGAGSMEFEAYEPTEADVQVAKMMGRWDDGDPAASRLALMRAKGAKIPVQK
jgi:hypothetical protein